MKTWSQSNVCYVNSRPATRFSFRVISRPLMMDVSPGSRKSPQISLISAALSRRFAVKLLCCLQQKWLNFRQSMLMAYVIVFVWRVCAS